jgi:thioredoxin 1
VPAVVGAVRTSPLQAAALPRLLELGADTCIPCKAMVPVLDALRREYPGHLQVDFIDVLKHPDQAAPYHIYAMPTQIFFDASGRERYRHLGFFSKEDILATWRTLGVRLDASGKG